MQCFWSSKTSAILWIKDHFITSSEHKRYIRLLTKFWENTKVRMNGFSSQLLIFYQIDCNAIFNIVFANLFNFIISRPISYLSDKTKNYLKRIGNSRFCVDLAFWIIRTKCMINTNGLKMHKLALGRIDLHKVYRNPGLNPFNLRVFNTMLKCRGVKRVYFSKWITNTAKRP